MCLESRVAWRFGVMKYHFFDPFLNCTLQEIELQLGIAFFPPTSAIYHYLHQRNPFHSHPHRLHQFLVILDILVWHTLSCDRNIFLAGLGKT